MSLEPDPEVQARETARNEDARIANRTRALREILAEVPLPTGDKIAGALAALDAIVTGSDYPEWLIVAIRPEMEGEL